MKQKVVIAVMMLFTLSVVHAQQLPSAAVNRNLTYKIIPSENKTWGYNIYNDGNFLFISHLYQHCRAILVLQQKLLRKKWRKK